MIYDTKLIKHWIFLFDFDKWVAYFEWESGSIKSSTLKGGILLGLA